MEAFERRQTGTEGHRGGLLQRHFSCAVGKRACGDWSSLWEDEDAQDPRFPGDEVTIELSAYDLSRGRIVRREKIVQKSS